MSYCDFFRSLREKKVEDLVYKLEGLRPGHQEEVGQIIRSFCILNDCPDIFGDLQLLNYYKDIGLPLFSDLICQPKRFSQEEKMLVARHPFFSAHILDLEGFEEVMGVDLFESILYHHERWDGSGFFRKRREEIPHYARLLAPMDFYVSLTSNRPYRGAVNEEVALKEIYNEAGRKFDPAILDKVIEAIQTPVEYMNCARPQCAN